MRCRGAKGADGHGLYGVPTILIGIGIALLFVGGIALAQEEDRSQLGGQTTIEDASSEAFEQPAPHLDPLTTELFRAGGAFFKLYWVTTPVSTTQTDGLAPLFNARSCESCHFKNGRGQPPQAAQEAPMGLVLQLSLPQANNDPDPTYGRQLQDQESAREGIMALTYSDLNGQFADGTSYTLQVPTYVITGLAYGSLDPQVSLSPRISPQLAGLGLLEAISDEDLLALSDPNDLNGDGISGRVNLVWDVVNQTERIGRFGWRAEHPTLAQVVGHALSEDMGITSPLFPRENCTPNQPICPTQALTEMTLQDLLEVTAYVSALAVPAQREAQSPQVQAGAALFEEASCSGCHVPTFLTGQHPSIPVLSSQTIHPYTDLLLHDMGDGLADRDLAGQITQREWRTPPLWGIGLFQTVGGHTFYLHDGRARDLNEAILWHGGEAQASLEAYLGMTSEEREALLAFLRSL